MKIEVKELVCDWGIFINGELSKDLIFISKENAKEVKRIMELDIENKRFKEQQIRDFLNAKGIGIFDTAYQVIRLKGNAADKFLQIHTPTDLKMLLERMPDCRSIMTTGDKATDTLMLSMPENAEKPVIGASSRTHFAGRDLSLYRMPSSSRAYPLALEKKAEAYRQLFTEIGLL